MKTLTEIFSQDVLIDSHCHCSSIEVDLATQIADAKAQGVNYIVDVATDLDSSLQTYVNFNKFPENILPAAGLHPELLVPGSDLYDPEYDENKIRSELSKLGELLTGNQYFAIGECGLDHYWLEKGGLTPEAGKKSRDLQTLFFQGQIDLALKIGLPMTIHSRAAEDTCLELLKPLAHKITVIFHSFTGSYDQARQVLEMGFKLGVNGIITYRSAQDLREIYKKIIGNRKFTSPRELYDLGICLETDAPLLIPSNTTFHDHFNSPKQVRMIWNYLLQTFNNGQKAT